MSKRHMQEQRLKEVSALVGTLTEQMMTSYAVGSSPSDTEVMAFCRGVLLLEEHAVPLPHLAEDVIARLQVQDTAAAARLPVEPAPPVVQGGSMLGRLLRPLRMLRAA